MIKTHRPRGHIWTNASAFQQTPEYRNFKYDELIPRATEVLVRDPDDFLPVSKRAAKRRRIEKLADEFLNGKPLFIASARPCPKTLETIVTWNKKSSDEPKFVLPKIDVAPDESIWEDVENDAEILERLTRSRLVNPIENHVETGVEVEGDHSRDQMTQATRGRLKANVMKINTGPSEEALKQAAALRARRMERAISEVPIVRHSSDVKKIIQIVTEASNESSNKTSEQHAELSKDWLSRRKSRFSFSNHDPDEESGDELRLSRIETPSTNTDRKSSRHEVSRHNHSNISSVQTDMSEMIVQAPSQIATNDTPQESSIANRTRRSTRTASAKSNAAVESGARGVAFKARGKKRAYKSAEANQNGSTPFMFRKGCLTSHDDDTISDITKPPEQEKRSKDRDALLSDNIEVGIEKTDDNETKTLARKPPLLEMSFGHDSSFAPNLNMALVDEHLNAVLPAAAASDGNTSAVKKAIRRELRKSGAEVTRCGSEPPPSSQVGEPQNSDEVSSHGNSRLNTETALKNVAVAENQSGPSQFWAGTQVLLERAQKELFTSPEKKTSESNHARTDDARAVQPAIIGSSGSLNQLSEERTPGPSTQAMLADFKGFSTVKKPGTRYGESMNPTPGATGKANGERHHDGPSTLFASTISSNGNTSLRRSSLRFAKSANESQLDTASKYTASSILAPPEPHTIRRSSINATTPASILKSSHHATPLTRLSEPDPKSQIGNESFGQDITIASFESDLAVSSFQAAQHRSRLSREDSDINRTIDELATGLLDLNEMNGVLSQASQ